jgi:hypothetical protein
MVYTCYKCFYKTNRKESLIKHINRKSPCIRCSESYSKFTDKELENNMNEQLNNKTDYSHLDDKKKYECEICKSTFNEKYNLNKHLKKHTEIKTNIIFNSNNCNNVTNITNIQNINLNIAPIPFDKEWDLSKIDELNIQSLLLSNMMYTKLLEEILKNEINLNVIIENESTLGLVYKNDIDKYEKMKIKDIIEKSMDKLNKHLVNLNSNINSLILEEYVKKSKDIIDKKFIDYNLNKDNVQEKVNDYIKNMYSNVSTDAIHLCKRISNNNNGY